MSVSSTDPSRPQAGPVRSLGQAALGFLASTIAVSVVMVLLSSI